MSGFAPKSHPPSGQDTGHLLWCTMAFTGVLQVCKILASQNKAFIRPRHKGGESACSLLAPWTMSLPHFQVFL